MVIDGIEIRATVTRKYDTTTFSVATCKDVTTKFSLQMAVAERWLIYCRNT